MPDGGHVLWPGPRRRRVLMKDQRDHQRNPVILERAAAQAESRSAPAITAIRTFATGAYLVEFV
jgi:hypothetical protein